MYCKLCGKHLYEKITFRILFKLNYHIHIECEELLNRNNEYLTFPLLDKIVLIDYLFEERYDDSDELFLYEKFSENLFSRLLRNSDWSIIVFTEKKFENETVILLLKLAEKAVLFVSVFNENFM